MDKRVDAQSGFEQLYLRVREAERRVYSDDQVRSLPEIDSAHVHFKEWQIRKASAQRLIGYLEKKQRQLCILEVGCGNGWLSSMMATMKNVCVTGVDVNAFELEQGRKVFGAQNNIDFQYGDIRHGLFENKTFDVIVFAASIQYFASLVEILDVARSLLKADGEIHIVDSHFYSDSEIVAAKTRTHEYYNAFGCPGMAEYYFHHSWGELNKFDHSLLYDPRSLVNKLFKKPHPFCWVCVKK